MLNHTDELKDVRTIAHESGHAINSELMKKRCDTLSCGMVLSTAEVASTFMEDFVTERLLKEADDEAKLSLMMDKLNEEISTIFRQIACYKFEQMLHKEFRNRGYLSKEEIGEIFQKNMAAYMGDAVKMSPGSENWWIYWSHIRRFFYVYSYASGLLISKALQSKVRKNKSFIKDVKEFLASGTTDSPKNIFAKLGIDITKKEFWDNGLKEVEDLLDKTEAFARKLKKI
jgi:oligoendopeptidase F